MDNLGHQHPPQDPNVNVVLPRGEYEESRQVDLQRIARLERYGYVLDTSAANKGYGSVYTIIHTATKELYVVRLRPIIQGQMTGCTVREISMLQNLKHPNIIGLKQAYILDDCIAVVMGNGVWNLEEIILTHKNEKTTLKPEIVKYFLRGMLSGIAFLHKLNVIHREIKPSNIMLNEFDTVQITDFRSARPWFTEGPLTPEMTTALYRAPEIWLGSSVYTTAIDMWSVGCIFAEMLMLTPLFKSEEDDIYTCRIFKRLGTPNEETWPGVTSLPLFSEDTPNYIAQGFEDFPGLDEEGKDLLWKMLCLNPERRISAAEALEHPYLLGIENDDIDMDWEAPALN